MAAVARLTLLTRMSLSIVPSEMELLHTWPARRIAAAVRARELSAEEVTRHHLQRMAAHEHLHTVDHHDGRAGAGARRGTSRSGRWQACPCS